MERTLKIVMALLLFIGLGMMLPYPATCQKNVVTKARCDIDSDQDGVADCFDKCPDSLHVERVDSHGCPRDTDGDGLADYLDQQLITPGECFPVDANGIGICPCNCPDKYNGIIEKGFTQRKLLLNTSNLKFDHPVSDYLDILIQEMKQSPNFRVVISLQGNAKQLSGLALLQEKCKQYLLKKEMDEERLIFITGLTASSPFIEIRNP